MFIVSNTFQAKKDYLLISVLPIEFFCCYVTCLEEPDLERKCGACVTKWMILPNLLCLFLFCVKCSLPVRKITEPPGAFIHSAYINLLFEAFVHRTAKSTILLQTYLMLCLLCVLSSWSICFSMFIYNRPQTQTNQSHTIM